jgi:hypothetical protein
MRRRGCGRLLLPACLLPTQPDQANHHRRRHPLRLPLSCITLVPDRPKHSIRLGWIRLLPGGPGHTKACSD